MSRRRRRVIVCAACGEPVTEDEPGTLTDRGAVLHRRCGGEQVSMGTFAGP